MRRQDPGVVLIPVASPLHDPADTERVLSGYRDWLTGLVDSEFPLVSSVEGLMEPELRKATGLIALVLTGGTEQIVGGVAALGRPLLVLAHDSMNSLPAGLEAVSSIENKRVRLILGKGSRQAADVRRFAAAARALGRIRRHKIGLIGGPSPWLTYSLPDSEALAARLGVRVFEVPMEAFNRAYLSAMREMARAPPIQVAALKGGSGEVSASDFEKSEGIFRALRSLAHERGFSAVSPRCFDFIKAFGATGCLALSKLNDEGVIAGCEGDVPSTVGMIAMAEVSGKPAFMGNPSFIKGHRLVLAHCTVATKLTESIRYRPHFESGVGVALAGEFRKGALVTVARFGKGYGLLRAGAGRVAKGKPWSNDLCRTQVEIRMKGSAEAFLNRPTGNHLVMTYGDQVDTLGQLASSAGIEFEEL